MAKTTKMTKETFHKDLQSVLYTVMEQFRRIYGTIALIDGRNGKELIRFNGRAEDDAAALDLDELPVTYYMNMIYDYVIDGRLDKQLMNEYEVIEEDLALCEFVDVSKNNVQEILREGIDLVQHS